MVQALAAAIVPNIPRCAHARTATTVLVVASSSSGSLSLPRPLSHSPGRTGGRGCRHAAASRPASVSCRSAMWWRVVWRTSSGDFACAAKQPSARSAHTRTPRTADRIKTPLSLSLDAAPTMPGALCDVCLSQTGLLYGSCGRRICRPSTAHSPPGVLTQQRGAEAA